MPPFVGGQPQPSDFESRYDGVSHARTQSRRDQPRKPFDPDRALDPKVAALIADRIYLRDLKEARLVQGYAYPGGLLGEDWIAPFREAGLRSEIIGLSAKRFVAATARRLESGRTKAGIATGSSKLLGLDDPYVRLNREVVCGFRIDIDARFASFDALHDAVAACRLPALPHLVVGRRDRDGVIHNPHLWYLLPDTGVVWMRGLPRVVGLLHRVIAGITLALAGVGADPGGLANPFHGKNPLCPLFSTEMWNETRFPTLGDWAAQIDLTARDQTGLAAASRRGEIVGGSNSRARTLFRWAIDALRSAHDSGEPAYQQAVNDKPALGQYLLDTLSRDAVIHLRWDDAETLARHCRRIAERWDPTKLARRKRRGAIAQQLAPDASLVDRQRAGQRHTADMRRKASVTKIADAIREIKRARRIPTQTAVAQATGLSRSTVVRNWAEARQSSLSRLVIRKKGLSLKGKPGAVPPASATCVRPSPAQPSSSPQTTTPLLVRNGCVLVADGHELSGIRPGDHRASRGKAPSSALPRLHPDDTSRSQGDRRERHRRVARTSPPGQGRGDDHANPCTDTSQDWTGPPNNQGSS